MRKVSNINIESEVPLPTPDEIRSELPVTADIAENIWQFRLQVANIVSGRDPRILMICGPCSIDSIPAAMEYAARFCALKEKVEDQLLLVMRAYFEKPRTTIGWKGLVYDPDLDRSYHIEKGLRLARKLLLNLAEMGIPAATEFLEPTIPQYTSDLISWASIGARTSESQTHRQMASGLSMPVGFKNSTDGSIAVAVDAIRTASARHSFLGVINDGRTGMFITRGNPHCHLVYNRINNEGKTISDQNDFRRNEQVTKLLKRKYGLTFSNGKGATKTKRLRGNEKTRYEVYHIVMNTLAQATSWQEFTEELKRNGVEMDIVMKKNGSTKIADIQGLRFTKDGKTFKASQIHRGMTYTKMDNILKRNAHKEQESKASYQHQISQSDQPRQEQRPEEQERHDESQQHSFGPSFSISSLGLFDTTNPVYDPEDEAFRRRLQQKKKKKRGYQL